MKYIKIGIVLTVVLLVLSACASTPGNKGWYQDWKKCAAVGVAAGLAAGATDDKDAALAGAAGGAVVGGVICAVGDTDGDGVRNHKDKCPGTPAGGVVDSNGCEIDSDGDGVLDRLDDCPGTPKGVAVDEHGCEPDADADGVPDRLDRCPGTAAGAAVDKHGCEPDTDGDGVADRLDKCPGTAQGTPVDNNGCELPSAYELKGVNFAFDSAALTPESSATLDEAVKILKRHPDLKVEIAGHTDSVGTAAYNLGLSKRRAQSVADYLIAHGVDRANLTVKGYGETEPLADNATAAGRAANRRVELRH